TSDYLRFSPDPVLSSMLVNQGLTIQEEIAPFYPEGGAYGHHH
ncbi:MAG: urease accessory protein UreE, partial [Planktothrix agardhii]